MTFHRNMKLAEAFAAIALAAGCATGYNARLEAYQKNAAPPFADQTMAWLDADAGRAATSGSLEQAAGITLNDARPTTSSTNIAAELTAKVTGLPAERVAARLEALAESEAVARALGGRFGWEDLNLAVAASSPAVRAGAERWRAALEQFSQADALEALVGQYRAFTSTLDTGAGKPMNKAMTQAFFPFPGTLSLKGDLVRRQAELARLDWEKTLRDTLVQAGQAYFRYQYFWRAEATAEANVKLAADLLDVINQQYRTGGASQANLLKVQTELARQRNMLADLRARRAAAAADLNALLGRAADAPLGRPADRDLAAPAATDDLTSRALEGRQEWRIQRTKIARAEAALRLGETMNRPLASQGYSTFERGMRPDSATGASAPSFGLMPKTSDRPGYAEGEGYLAEMRRRLAAERAMGDQARAETEALARAWSQDLDIARRQLKLMRDVVVPQDRAAYDTSRSGYTAGGVTFLDLLDAERALLGAQLDLDQARRDLNQTLVRQANVTGQLPAPPEE